jgi:hypothetical protein
MLTVVTDEKKQPGLWREYFAMTFKHWWTVVVGVVAGVEWVFGESLHVFGYQLAEPRYTGAVIILLGVIVAQFLSFREMRELRNAALGMTGSATTELAIKELMDRVDELQKYRPRELHQRQMDIIAEKVAAWPAYRPNETYRRRMIHIAYSYKAVDGQAYAAQIAGALEAGGRGIAPPGENLGAFNWEFEEKFKKMHEANITIFGHDDEESIHNCVPVEDVIFDALKAADVDVTQVKDTNQYGGRVAVIIGKGTR